MSQTHADRSMRYGLRTSPLNSNACLRCVYIYIHECTRKISVLADSFVRRFILTHRYHLLQVYLTFAIIRVKRHKKYYYRYYYRAMHFSAYARSWDRMSSVRPSVRL